MIATRAEYLSRWGELHGLDLDQRGGLVRWWLSGMYAVAAPAARLGVTPGVVTLVGVLVAAGVPLVTLVGGRWLCLAALVAACSGMLDNLDGAVAVLTGRATRWGYVLDSVADRLADAAYLVALWYAGAPAWLAVAAGGVVVLLEYTRARAGNAGVGEVTVVTVGERPTRVIVTAAFLLAAGVTGDARLWSTLGSAATLGIAGVGVVQLLVALHRLLGGSGGGGHGKQD